MSKKAQYSATFDGRTFTRTSARAYTHAAIYRSQDTGDLTATFHGSEELAKRATYFWWVDYTKPIVKHGRMQGGYPSLGPCAVVPVEVRKVPLADRAG